MLTPAQQEHHARRFLPIVLAYAVRRAALVPGDPESAALIGLTRALRTWDPQGKASLRTWIFGRVRHEMQHDLRDNSHMGRRNWERYTGRMDELPPEWQRPVSLQGRLDMDGDPYEALLTASGEPVGAVAEQEAWLVDILGRLPEREAYIVRECVLHERAQSAVGAEVGITQMHVSRLKRKALRELRTILEGSAMLTTSHESREGC